MKKIISTITLLSIGLPIPYSFAQDTTNPVIPTIPVTSVQAHEFGHMHLVDLNDNNTLSSDLSYKTGSRVFGYIYDPKAKQWITDKEEYLSNPISQENTTANFTYKLPAGTCMEKTGLPAFLPINLDNSTQNITEENLKAPEGIDNKNYVRHIDNISGDSDYFKVITFHAQDNENAKWTIINQDNPNPKSPFFYSIDNGNNWVAYTNRDDNHIPEGCVITDFRIDNAIRSIYTYNFKITDENPETISSIASYSKETERMEAVLGDNGVHTGNFGDIGEMELVRSKIIEEWSQEVILKSKKETLDRQCSEANISIKVKEKPAEPEKPKDPENPPVVETPPTPPTPPKPDTPTSTGPGGNIPTPPTLDSAPLVVNKCENIIKNLDDAKLIEYFNKLKIEKGLNVHGDISRLDLVRLIVNAGYLTADENEDLSILDNFADIAKNSWYAPYVAKLINKDLVSVNDFVNDEQKLKLFGTNDFITRYDATKILTNVITDKKLKLPTLEEILTFSDVKPVDRNADYIQFAYSSCLLHGRKTLDGEPIGGLPRVFEAESNITIAETAKILYNGQTLR